MEIRRVERGIVHGRQLIKLDADNGPWPSWVKPEDRREREVVVGDWYLAKCTCKSGVSHNGNCPKWVLPV